MYQKYIKRVLDLFLSILALPVFLILFIIIGPVIYLEDKGPIFYNATRLGKDGKQFVMYKFRSMKENAPDLRNQDGSTFNAEDDPRLTKIGKFIRKTSIDETPQLLNVIKGDMSLMGPRPDLPGQLDLYEAHEERKLHVRPGLTGLNQAYYRNTIPWKERIKNDIYYVDNISLQMDIKIVLKTIVIILQRDKVFNEE